MDREFSVFFSPISILFFFSSLSINLLINFFVAAMDESPLSLPTNAPSMPNVPPLKSQYDSTEAEGQFDLLMFQFVWRMMRMMKILSDSVESDDDINEDFGLGDDRISREIWGK